MVLSSLLSKETSDNLADVIKIATVFTVTLGPLLHIFVRRQAAESNRVGKTITNRLEIHENAFRAVADAFAELLPPDKGAVLKERIKDLEKFAQDHKNDFGG